MVVYCLVGEPQDSNSLSSKVLGAQFVTRYLLFVSVNITVHFDRELAFDAERIEHKAPIRMLPAELQPGQAAAPKCIPELSL